MRPANSLMGINFKVGREIGVMLDQVKLIIRKFQSREKVERRTLTWFGKVAANCGKEQTSLSIWRWRQKMLPLMCKLAKTH